MPRSPDVAQAQGPEPRPTRVPKPEGPESCQAGKLKPDARSPMRRRPTNQSQKRRSPRHRTRSAEAGCPKPEKPKDDPFGANSNDVKTLRMWTDASGKYQVEARFVSFQDGTVRLQKANGRYVRMAYDQLCSVDQDFVLNQDQSLLAME